MGTPNLQKQNLASFLRKHYQIILILVGAAIILASMGTYTNWDSETEFEAVTSVVTKGFPYVTTGLMIDQAPLAFYLTAPAMMLFGLSYVNAVYLVSVFGLGCITLVYVLGTLLYGKNTGLVAAALFGLVPWQMFMSRVYLIDPFYLFLGLLFVTIGVLAVKRNSQKLLMLSGLFFALAFLTKLFAGFLLLPLLLYALLKGKETGFKVTPQKILLFLVPTFITQAFWYGGFANQQFSGVYLPPDFTHPELIANPPLEYMPRLFVESTGWFMLAAAVFALILTVSFRGQFVKTLRTDVVCVLSILVVVGIDLVLVLGRNLLVPYVSAFKYVYVALPFLCIFAASLAGKGALLFSSTGKRKVKLLLVGLGLVLLFASLVEETAFLNHSQPYEIIDFKVDLNGHYFPFFLNTAVSSYFQVCLYTGVTLILFSLLFPFAASAYRQHKNQNRNYQQQSQ